MRLDELTAGFTAGAVSAAPLVDTAVEITGLAYDSREVTAGDLFFCVSGFRSDGHDFAAQAVAAGAAALVVERPLELEVPEVLVRSARAAMAPLAARFFGDPSAELRVVGVTGTNGKTTTAYLLRALLQAGGEQCALLGTIKSVVAGRDRAVTRTTPEAIDLQSDFREMLDGGDRACAMEVSSHALELGRAEQIHFAAAIFTNLTQDHLDFHDTMEDYFQAKRLLFTARAPGVSVVNVGDPYGRRLAEEIDGARTFAVEAPADYSATALRCDFEGCAFTLHTPGGERTVTLPLPGRFNVQNALAAIAAAHALGGDLDTLIAALEQGVRVPGRFEPVDQGQDFAVLVDYAHTPDSLDNVLRAARELTLTEERADGRIICVFGAGGDRDRGKRPLMGEIAARLADVVVVTSDNPRSEDPEQIIVEVMAGVARVQAPVHPRGEDRHEGGSTMRPEGEGEGVGGRNDEREGAGEPDGKGERGGESDHERGPAVRSIADRAAAIEQAIARARRGDVVVIAGKGHEQGQEFADGHTEPFDDVTVARDALRLRAARSPLPARAARSAGASA